MQCALWVIALQGPVAGDIFLRYLFDLTTTAQWHGPAVGIVRVEQELARRARRYLGKDVAFCFYDCSDAAILVIDDAAAEEIIAGRIRVDLSQPRATPVSARLPQISVSPIRRKIRLALLRSPMVYHLSQRVRRRSFTREQISRIQALELTRRTVQLAAEEDDRQLRRERARLMGERNQHANRIKGLLAIQGINDYDPIHCNRMQRLELLRTAEGRMLAPRLKAEIVRELQSLELAIGMIQTIEAKRDAIASAESWAERSNARKLLNLVGPESNEVEVVPLADLPHHQAQLDPDTTIISGGLDWQYKDLRLLWELKQAHGFSYCAIVYDLIPLRFPQFVTPEHVQRMTDYFGELIWLADQSMCISTTTRQDWVRHAHDVGAQPVASGVFPLGCDLSPQAQDASLNLSPALKGRHFALYVSTIEPRKNHYMLYQAWEECIRTNQLDPEYNCLVFVGRRGWATGDFLHQVETNPLTRDTIIILDDASDEQLASLYQNCSFVLFPSICEGFGLPLAEALGYGKPCVSSDTGALLEIGGDLVMRLDPKDTLAWSRAISRLMSSSELKEWEDRIRKQYRSTPWADAAAIFFNTIAACGGSGTLNSGKVSASTSSRHDGFGIEVHEVQTHLPALASDPRA